jgi:CRP/FNR family transcriptional regulator, cyclic AMP receptor protein
MKAATPSWETAGPECLWSMALEGLTQDECDAIYDRLHRKRYDPRSRIFTFGDKADALLIVESGRMKMFRSSEAGMEFTIGIWSTGYTTGLISTLLDQPRIVSVDSVERTVMLVLPRQDLFDLMRSIPNFAINIARLAASIAQFSMVTTSPLALDSAAVRLSKVLASVAMEDGVDASKTGMIVRGLNQEDLASMVGVSRTWVTLMLSTFESQGLIWRKRRQIGICDLDALQKFCRDRDPRNHRL